MRALYCPSGRQKSRVDDSSRKYGSPASTPERDAGTAIIAAAPHGGQEANVIRSRSRMPIVCAVFPALLLAGCGAPAPEPEPAAEEPAAPVAPAADFTLPAENTHNRWSSTIPPVLTVPSGAVVEIHTKEASDGQITPDTTVEDLASVDFGLIHALTGPIRVEGAEPGDLLAVTIHEVEVTGWGWATILPGFGFLADEFTEPWIRGFDLGPESTEVDFGSGITIPLDPFPGVLGVAPATEELLVTIPPRENGGNMDNRYMKAGATVYLPVQVEGANFSVGDAHAVQGDGEVSGTAVEVPVRLVVTLDVVENPRGITEAEYETDEYYGTTGFAPTIDEAAKKATRAMIGWLVDEHGLTPEEAYVLCSLAGDLKISETVDVPHMLVSMHMPKSLFASGD